MKILLASLNDTARLAGRLARRLSDYPAVRALMLHGPLGSGKTTFACALAQSLPGGENAETGSPSFNLCNHYPTIPAMLHGDMYRCPGYPPEEITEALQRDDILTVVEWAEFLPEDELPEEFLDITFAPCKNYVCVNVSAIGGQAGRLLEELARQQPEI
jgi:tRNA threonylcarbamoyladenosine biosynthesis protein TsaE